MITLSVNEADLIKGVFCELLSQPNAEGRFGSLTVAYMACLVSKLSYADFCERHDINYEDMTDLDFEAAYREKWDELCEA